MVADRARTSGAVVSRWLKYLTAEGLMVGDGAGGLDEELTLSGIGMEKTETILLEARMLKDKFTADR
jgi:hypothetical protein